MKKLILIKFGGSLITDKTKINVAKRDVINTLTKQIADVIRRSRMESDRIRQNPIKSDYIRLNPIKSPSIIIATGAGGFGHPVAKKYEHNLKDGLPEIKKAVKEINGIVVDSLKKVGLKSEAVEPSRIAEYKDGKMVSLLARRSSKSEVGFYGFIVSWLENNVIPVFHADLIDDKKLGISILSMDRFLVDMAIYLKHKGFDVEKVIFCGTTDGVLDKEGKTIKKINKINISKLENYFYDNKTVDTSGGMRGKVDESLKLINEEIPCVIIDGQKENNLIKTILGQEVHGTTISK